jgi:hypothetical protein
MVGGMKGMGGAGARWISFVWGVDTKGQVRQGECVCQREGPGAKYMLQHTPDLPHLKRCWKRYIHTCATGFVRGRHSCVAAINKACSPSTSWTQ